MTSNFEYSGNFVLVNESKVRLTALMVLFITLIYLATDHWTMPAFLVVDFFLRAFNLGEYSILNIISDNLVNVLNIAIKPIDQAPKRFAARIGLLFSAAILALTFFDHTTAALFLTVTLAVSALLEASLGFCAGCHMYTFYQKLFKKKTT